MMPVYENRAAPVWNSHCQHNATKKKMSDLHEGSSQKPWVELSIERKVLFKRASSLCKKDKMKEHPNSCFQTRTQSTERTDFFTFCGYIDTKDAQRYVNVKWVWICFSSIMRWPWEVRLSRSWLSQVQNKRGFSLYTGANWTNRNPTDSTIYTNGICSIKLYFGMFASTIVHILLLSTF